MKFISLAIFIRKHTEKNIELWMQTREEEGSLKGYWEFPGGNIEKNESPIDAAIREVKEEVNIDIPAQDITKFNNFSYNINDTNIEFFTFIVKNAKPENGQWFNLSLKDVRTSLPEKIPPANYGLIEQICHAFGQNDPKEFDLLWTK